MIRVNQNECIFFSYCHRGEKKATHVNLAFSYSSTARGEL